MSVRDIMQDAEREYIDYEKSHTLLKVKNNSKSGIIPVGGLQNIRTGKRWGLGSGISSFSQGYRVYDVDGISPCLVTTVGGLGGYSHLYYDGIGVFKLRRGEIESLQGIPNGYTAPISLNKAAFHIGNGWTVNVIEHIFKGLNND